MTAERKRPMRVLVATDGEVGALEAIAALLPVLRLDEVALTVLAVAARPKLLVDHGVGAYLEAQEEADRAAADALAAARRRVAGLDVPADFVLRAGEPAEEILRFAASQRPDLVVLSSHRRGLLGRWVWGSVSEAVRHGWPGPVLVVPAPA